MSDEASDADYIRRQNFLNIQINALEDEKCILINKIKALKQEKEEMRLQHSLTRLKNRPKASEWIKKEYNWSKQVNDILKKTFHFDHFRSNQLAAINATLSKKHVLLIMPTGGGKSLVYQLPSLVTGNVSVVISPLLSLIEDQLMSLLKLGISAATVNSSSSSEEKKEVAAKMMSNRLNLIFVTPEWLAKQKMFMNNLTKLHKEGKLERFVIDEVHCCSQWGHDFRSDYLSLSLLKKQFPGVPILGLTATATSNVLVDIQKILNIPEAIIITAPYNRPNLYYEVVTKPEGREAAIDYLETLLKGAYKDKSGIIYAATQRDCEELSSELKNRFLSVAPYHANLLAPVKNKIHRKWSENKIQVVIATIAFGMGIDKPDVRFVIHYAVPKSLEGLYQESGRAGRDGEKADCLMLYNLTDWLKNFALSKNTKEENTATEMLNYCINVTMCRRKLIAKHFDDDWRSSDCKQMCDQCRNKSTKIVETYNVITCLDDIMQLISLYSSKEINVTLKKLLESWFQTGPKNVQLPSAPKPRMNKEHAEHIIGFLLSRSYLIIRRGYSMVQTLAYIDTNLDTFFDREKLGNELLMEYAGKIRGMSPVSFTTHKHVASTSQINDQGPTVPTSTAHKEKPVLYSNDALKDAILELPVSPDKSVTNSDSSSNESTPQKHSNSSLKKGTKTSLKSSEEYVTKSNHTSKKGATRKHSDGSSKECASRKSSKSSEKSIRKSNHASKEGAPRKHSNSSSKEESQKSSSSSEICEISISTTPVIKVDLTQSSEDSATQNSALQCSRHSSPESLYSSKDSDAGYEKRKRIKFN